MNPIRRVVILGHSGFIGSHLEKRLAAGPARWEVLGRSLPGMDLTRDESIAQLEEFFDDATAVVLCAAVKRQFGDTLDVYLQNMAIVENVVRAFERKPVARLLFMSSAAVYGEETHNTAITEATPVHPTSHYGIAKFAGECLLRKAFASVPASRLLCLRPPLVYGPGDRGKTYGPAGFCAAAREGTPITLWGDGRELREFIYVDDLCAVLESLLGTADEGWVNVVSGKSHDFASILDVLRAQGASLQVATRERSKQKVDNAFVPDRLRQLLPGFAFAPLEEGIRRTWKETHA